MTPELSVNLSVFFVWFLMSLFIMGAVVTVEEPIIGLVVSLCVVFALTYTLSTFGPWAASGLLAAMVLIAVVIWRN